MSGTAERVLNEIKGLPLADLQAIWKHVSHLVAEAGAFETAPGVDVSEAEFEAALDEVTGCTAGSNSGQRLLQERRKDLEREQTVLATRARERDRG